MHTDNNRVAKILRKIPWLDGLVMNRKEEREREREREQTKIKKQNSKFFIISQRTLFCIQTTTIAFVKHD